MEVRKAVNTNYITAGNVKRTAVNKANRAYIDKFVSMNYERLSKKFDNQRNVINSNGFGSLDKLNDLILSLYTDSELNFSNWYEANKYLTSKFTDKAIRVVMKKPTEADEDKTESEDTDTDYLIQEND